MDACSLSNLFSEVTALGLVITWSGGEVGSNSLMSSLHDNT